MPTINLGGNPVVWSFGSLIAIVVFIVAVILMILGTSLTPLMVLGFIAALALARIT